MKLNIVYTDRGTTPLSDMINVRSLSNSKRRQCIPQYFI